MSTEKTAENLPAYGFEDLLKIAGLANQPMLKRDRRQLAEGQQPAGQYWSGHAWVLLYRAADAIDMPPLSPGRQRLYDKARTCALCGATRKETYAKGRDGKRYCAQCQKPAAVRLWEQERATDRPLVVEWARSVLADSTVVLGSFRYHNYWKENLVVDLDGAVLLDANIRHSLADPYDEHPLVEQLRQMSPLAVMDQIEALRGRRMIAWSVDSGPDLVTSWDENGWPAAHATKVARDDTLGRWYDRWVGEITPNGSYLHHPRLREHWAPRDPREHVARMREVLTEMAGGEPARTPG
jgi:hypothetical protein